MREFHAENTRHHSMAQEHLLALINASAEYQPANDVMHSLDSCPEERLEREKRRSAADDHPNRALVKVREVTLHVSLRCHTPDLSTL